MSESTLSLTRDKLLDRLARKASWADGKANRTSNENTVLDRILQSSLRRVYMAYDWSYMKPTTTLSLVADQWEYDLPDDFGGIEGRIDYQVTASSARPYAGIEIRGAHEIYEMRMRQNTSSWPKYAATRPKAHPRTVSGTADGQGVFGSPNTTLTATTSVFASWMIGASTAGTRAVVTFTTSGNSYPVTSVTSGTVAVIIGDASGETTDDTFTVTSQQGQRWELIFYPTPTQAYTLLYTYAVLLDAITGDNAGASPPTGYDATTPALPGPAYMDEVIFECMLWLWDKDENDNPQASSAEFDRLLADAIEMDRRAFQAETLGYNSDTSDWLERGRPRYGAPAGYAEASFTVGGVTPA